MCFFFYHNQSVFVLFLFFKELEPSMKQNAGNDFHSPFPFSFWLPPSKWFLYNTQIFLRVIHKLPRRYSIINLGPVRGKVIYLALGKRGKEGKHSKHCYLLIENTSGGQCWRGLSKHSWGKTRRRLIQNQETCFCTITGILRHICYPKFWVF